MCAGLNGKDWGIHSSVTYCFRISVIKGVCIPRDLESMLKLGNVKVSLIVIVFGSYRSRGKIHRYILLEAEL